MISWKWFPGEMWNASVAIFLKSIQSLGTLTSSTHRPEIRLSLLQQKKIYQRYSGEGENGVCRKQRVFAFGFLKHGSFLFLHQQSSVARPCRALARGSRSLWKYCFLIDLGDFQPLLLFLSLQSLIRKNVDIKNKNINSHMSTQRPISQVILGAIKLIINTIADQGGTLL